MELVVGRKRHRVLIDDADWELVKGFRIGLDGKDGYVQLTRQRNSQCVRFAMHRFLMQAAPGEIVDHIDGNRLNNTFKELFLAKKYHHGR